MKIKILLMMMIFLITTVVAYPVSFWITSPNGDFSLSVYRCTSHACTTIDSFLSSSSGFINEFTIPSSYTGTNYFAMYAYKNGFVPHTYRITTFGDTGPGPWENAIQFYKDNNCYSNIQSLILSTNSVQVGQSVQIDATVQSVYVFNDMVKVIPTALRNHYSNVVDVMLYVDGQLIETKQTNIVWNESRQLSFSYTPTSLGSKQVQIRTRVDNDNACTGTTEVVRQSQLNVIDTSLPHVSASGSSNNWFNTQRVAVVSASDSGSGLAQVRYSWGTNQMNSACTSGGTVTSNGASLNAPISGTTLYLCARDNSGNVATWNGNYRWETTAPICGSWSPSESPWKWSGGQLFTLSGSTDQGGSGINIAGGSCTTGSNHGDTCSVTISDNAGNTRICTSPINRIDNIPPHISASGSSNIWFNTQRVAVVSASDSGSGLAQVRYSWGTNQMNSACTSGGTVTSNGASLNAPISGTTLYLCARDNSGNVATWNGNYRWETTAPICGSWSPSESPWKWSGGQLFTLSGSTDQGGSGINIAGGSCTTGSNHGDTCSVTISDSAGNTRICTSPINRIDNIPPHISASGSSTEWFTIPRVAVVNATDSKSGIVEVRYSWGTNQMNSACTSGGTVTSNGASLNAPIGGTTLYLCARDAVGNNAAWYGFYNWDYVCYSDSDCGLEDTIYACNGNYQHVATTIVPTCFNPGTVDSVCFDIESQVTELCNHICDDALGCDYTQCSDGIDNDGDGLIDYPEDPGCESYYDDDESSATILCFQDLDCGIGSLSYSCVDGNHVGTEISPTCFNPGTKHSFCFDVVSSITEICDYVCDDILGCDYAPVECSSDLDCGVGSLSYSCVDGNYVTTETVPTCFNSGTVYSFCFDVVSSTTEICDYVCDDALGCDYAPIECSSDLDCG
ncbi:MAG: hypothetical protein ACMXYG_06815, partial [Candidatus Woesearchaeota archaeon]